MQFPWYVPAIAAAFVWGIHYPFVEDALRKLSIISVLLLSVIGVLVIAPFFYKDLAADYTVIKALDWRGKASIAIIILTSVLGPILIYLSIFGKNATLASLIEITYPVFVAVFAYLLFGHLQISASIVAGGVLIFAGLFLIIWFNPT